MKKDVFQISMETLQWNMMYVMPRGITTIPSVGFCTRAASWVNHWHQRWQVFARPPLTTLVVTEGHVMFVRFPFTVVGKCDTIHFSYSRNNPNFYILFSNWTSYEKYEKNVGKSLQTGVDYRIQVEVAGRCIRESHSQGYRADVCRQHAPPMVAETLLPHLWSLLLDRKNRSFPVGYVQLCVSL